MYYLTINFNLCNNCGTCEKMLGGFRSKYNGVVAVSKNRYFTDEEVCKSCEDVMNACEQKAIYLEGR